uniref:Insulinoma-associated 1a n=1 Tax=Hippocampus comes TaxID=109280 RepID=A0A3Q2YPD0_HIPCM
MPRGFLVKRSKRLNLLSYRSQCKDECRAARFGIPEGVYRALCSPTWPASGEQEAERHPASGLASPVSAEVFPAALAALGNLFNMGSSTSAKRTADPEFKVKPATKRVKNMRKLHFEDHVTTSPVLGLKIRDIPAAERRSPGGTDGEPRGQFVCQLCGEAYADPLGLAQHRCSRIVRVEYRCPECDKGFSCPANLASHRRWHKPKAEAKSLPAAEPGSSESSSEGEEPHERAQGTERFKRQSCLRKRVAMRHTPIDLSAAAGAQACPTRGEAHAGAPHAQSAQASRCKRYSPGLDRCRASEGADELHGRQVVSASASRF